MKHLWPFFLLLLLTRAQAQGITGKIIDKDTRLPLNYIFIASTSGTAFTDDNGVFRLKISNIFDTIRINVMGYKPFICAFSNWGTATHIIELEMSYKQIAEVTIRAQKNYFKDSVALRKDYAKQFNFRGPKFNEIFAAPSPNIPFAYMSINVTQLFRAIYKNTTPTISYNRCCCATNARTT